MNNRTFIKKSAVSGRGLFAKENIEPGQCIATIPRPLVAVLDSPLLEDTCSNCFVSARNADDGDTFKVSACAGCSVVRYCSKKCQKESWKHHHKHECKVFSLSRDSPEGRWPNVGRAVVQLLTMKITGGITDEQWNNVMQLESHLEEKVALGSKDWKTAELIAAGTLGLTQKVYPKVFDIEFAKALLARIMTNSLTLVSSTFDPLGMVFDPYAALVNHSCNPNASIVMNEAALSLRSIKKIAKDEEIFITYTDSTEAFYRRQDALKDTFHFTCACTKCLEKTSTIEDEWNKPLNQLPNSWKTFADEQFRKDRKLLNPSNYVGDGEDAKRMHILNTLVYAKLDKLSKMNTDKETAVELEEGMRICHETQMWPLHRQPYPMLRHELMLILMDGNDYAAATMHAVKAYFFVDPVLYPYEHDPIRVVHKYTLATLLLYMAGGPEHEAFVGHMQNHGVVAAVIAWTLLLEVQKGLPYSHGVDSKLAQRVHKKLEEVSAELCGGRMTLLKGLKEEAALQWPRFRAMAEWAKY